MWTLQYLTKDNKWIKYKQYSTYKKGCKYFCYWQDKFKDCQMRLLAPSKRVCIILMREGLVKAVKANKKGYQQF